jgi:bifunctional DNA-binding transcriptional regulator/antitoxin component of YhaV-PrlF toxin-antitoxin module
MATAKVTPEGYIDVPRDILDRMHLHAGDTLEVQVEHDWALRMLREPLKASEVGGMFRSRIEKSFTVEEMDEAVAEAFRKGEL